MKITVKKAGTLFEFLMEQYPDSPRTRIKKLLQSGDIRLNNKAVTLHSVQLKPGDTIEINRQGKTASRGSAPFPVLYEDNYLIAIDKPAGIATSNIDGSKNVRDILNAYLRDISKGKTRSYVVHRLDKEVSGILLFAKSEEISESIKEKWTETEKHYYALVEGKPGKTEGTIESWLIEDSQQKVHSTFERRGAKYAISHYSVIREKDPYTLLDIRTDTGRKNQIRVQLSDMGCPIVGDYKYGASSEFVRRIRLHAYSLDFPHPVTGKAIRVESSMPAGFLDVREEDEKYK